MKQDNFPAYIKLTNSALSNALALECMMKAYIDEQKTEFLESAFSIASDQLDVIRNIRSISDTEMISDMVRLSARALGVYLMLSSLSDAIESNEDSATAQGMPEAVLTMINSSILAINTIRCKASD